MDKLLGLAADVAKGLLPVAADMAKTVLNAGLKLAGSLGKLGLSAVKSRGTKKLLHKGRKVLRITALASGCVMVLSIAGLVLSHRK